MTRDDETRFFRLIKRIQRLEEDMESMGNRIWQLERENRRLKAKEEHGTET